MATPSSPFLLNSRIKPPPKPAPFSSFPTHFPSRRRRFISFSSSNPSPSSSFSCCCSSTSTNNDSAPRSDELKLDKLSDSVNFVPVLRNYDEPYSDDDDEVLEEDVGEVDRRSFWKRFFSVSSKFRSIVLLNAITVIYASNIPVVKEVEGFVNPEVFTVVRFVFAAIPFIPFLLKAGDDVQIRSAGIELGFWISLAYLMQALGLQTSDAGRASFISMFTVIVVPFLDGMLGSVIPMQTWYGALTSLVGVGMLESSGSPPCVGDLLTFLSAVFFGVHMLRTEHISRSVTKKSFLALLGYEVCVVALLSAVWCAIGGCISGIPELNPSSWSSTELWGWIVEFPWLPALYTGFFSTGLCLWIEMSAMRDVSATETAIIYGLEPVWGAAFAWFLLGERWGAKGWIGAALVLGGSLAVQIFGASSSTSSQKDRRNIKQNNELIISDKHAPSVVVSSCRDTHSLLKK